MAGVSNDWIFYLVIPYCVDSWRACTIVEECLAFSTYILLYMMTKDGCCIPMMSINHNTSSISSRDIRMRSFDCDFNVSTAYLDSTHVGI
jgi:hypothetical protein